MAENLNNQRPDNSGSPTDKPTRDEDSDDDRLMKVRLANLYRLEMLDRSLFERSQFGLVVLREDNYYVWSVSHKHFLQSRGMWGIVSGSLPRPTASENEARKWMLLDGLIATHLFGHMKRSQQGHVSHLTRSKDIWDKLRGFHYKSAHIRRLLLKFWRYKKPTDESVDLMASKLECLCHEMHDGAPQWKVSEKARAIAMIQACQGDEYRVAKYLLRQADTLTPELALGHLWLAEQGSAEP